MLKRLTNVEYAEGLGARMPRVKKSKMDDVH